VGQKAWVTKRINNALNEGRIKISGDDWRAESADNQIIEVGTPVEVLKVNSTILVVKSI
jgi:membrane protein implicated in regulation of membrane protease activity